MFNLFSKRQKKLRGEIPDVYVYDNINNNFKTQLIYIFKDSIGRDEHGYKLIESYKEIRQVLLREYGLFFLTDNHYAEPHDDFLNFFLSEKNHEKIIDVIELICQFIDLKIRENHWDYHPKLKVDDALYEINERFKEHGIGYSFENGEIIRIDSTFIHSEITKPTIALLWNEKFKGANEEYMKAHNHYLHGRNKECLNECLKAFESVLKTICNEKRWGFSKTDTSKKLIRICFENGLVPTFTQNQFTSLQNVLESGIPSIRNKLGGHGQGTEKISVDDNMTRYALNLTGSNIIFLINQSKIK
ncbi:STM4504/CBY_0614 family protein [Epilithonimonas sp.]|uniref:STM4504/CBY_0614 family protein n=1 Tax=Epilithonimonas sp. TaxID=2894511 RepID=UPI0035AF6674